MRCNWWVSSPSNKNIAIQTTECDKYLGMQMMRLSDEVLFDHVDWNIFSYKLSIFFHYSTIVIDILAFEIR